MKLRIVKHSYKGHASFIVEMFSLDATISYNWVEIGRFVHLDLAEELVTKYSKRELELRKPVIKEVIREYEI